MTLADALSWSRLAVALAFPWMLAAGGWAPALAFVWAAASDYLDGPIARARGTASPRGGVLDNVADIVFVTGAAATGAWLGLCTWLAPLAIGASVSGYVRASRRLARQAGEVRLARNRVGHAAGIANYVLAGALAARQATPAVPLAAVTLVAWATLAINGAAVGVRLRGTGAHAAAKTGA